MKNATVPLVVGWVLLVGVGLGQWLETTISMPDSLNNITEPRYLTYSSADNSVFVTGGRSTAVVIDGTTNQKCAWINLSSPSFYTTYNTAGNKVYCALPVSDSVAIIDGRTNRQVAAVKMPGVPGYLAYDSAGNKVYCEINDVLSVIDGAADTILTTLAFPTGSDLRMPCFNTALHKVYCASHAFDTVYVIDGAADTVIAALSVKYTVEGLCLNPTNGNVYCAAQGTNSVVAIDGVGDTVLARVAVGRGPRGICCNPARNKVYSANYDDDRVSVIDCATHTVVATVRVGDGPRVLHYNPLNDKVYCANVSGGSISVIDGASDSLLTTIVVEWYPVAFAWNPVQNRTYVANSGSGTLSVLRDAVGIEEPPVAAAPAGPRGATLIRGTLPLLGDEPAVLLDIAGRKVADLRPGRNDVRLLAPGVYFVWRTASSRADKVVIAR